MSELPFMGWLGIAVLGILGVYVTIRLGSSAFFRSLHEYRRKQNDKR